MHLPMPESPCGHKHRREGVGTAGRVLLVKPTLVTFTRGWSWRILQKSGNPALFPTRPVKFARIITCCVPCRRGENPFVDKREVFDAYGVAMYPQIANEVPWDPTSQAAHEAARKHHTHHAEAHKAGSGEVRAHSSALDYEAVHLCFGASALINVGKSCRLTLPHTIPQQSTMRTGNAVTGLLCPCHRTRPSPFCGLDPLLLLKYWPLGVLFSGMGGRVEAQVASA